MAGNLFHMSQADDTQADYERRKEEERQRRMLERQKELDKVPLPTKGVRDAKGLLRDRNAQLKKLEEENGI